MPKLCVFSLMQSEMHLA